MGCSADSAGLPVDPVVEFEDDAGGESVDGFEEDYSVVDSKVQAVCSLLDTGSGEPSMRSLFHSLSGRTSCP